MTNEIKTFEEFREYLFKEMEKEKRKIDLQDRIYEGKMGILNLLIKYRKKFNVSLLDIELLAIESLKIGFKNQIEHLNNLQTKLKENE